MAQSNYFRAEKVLHNWQSPEEDLGSNPVTIFFIKHLFTLNCTEKMTLKIGGLSWPLIKRKFVYYYA